MDLAEVLASVRRHWKLSVALALVVVTALVIFLFTNGSVATTERFRASSQVFVPAPDPDSGEVPEGVPGFLMRSPQEPAQQDDTKAGALDATDLGDVDRSEITLTGVGNEDGDTVFLRVEAPEPDVARSVNRNYARAFVGARRASVARKRRTEARGIQDNLTVLEGRLSSINNQLRSQNLPLTPVPQPEQQGTDTGEDTATAGGPGVAPSPPDLNLPPNISQETVLLYAERSRLDNTIDALRNDYANAITEAQIPSSYTLEVDVDQEVQSVSADQLSPLIPIGIALAIAALLVLGVPVLVDRFDRSIKDTRGASNGLSAPVLSTIPATSRGERPGIAAAGSPQASAYRSLATLSVATDRLPRSIMITAPTGHTQDAVAVNFAATLAQLGLRVALVATSPRQAWYLAGDADHDALPLPELLDRANRAQLNGEVQHRLAATELANLFVVPPADTEGSLPLDGLPPLLDALEHDAHDVTVIAGPAMLDDPDATIMAWSTRSVLWAVPTGEISDAEAREAAGRLALAGVNPFGIVMVGRST